MNTFALAIPHTPWKPERVASYARLKDAILLGLAQTGSLQDARVFDEKAPNHVWSENLWTWAAETKATHLLQLQDDAIVAPNFWPALRAMVGAVSDQVIGLEVAHVAARHLADEGHRWFTTTDGLIGVGYVLPTMLLREFLSWRSTALKPGAPQHITEDTLIGLWCAATGRRVWHPVPTLIDHDVSLPSTYDNDSHPGRRPVVRWSDPWPGSHLPAVETLERPEFWLPRDLGDGLAVPHVGRYYDATPGLLREFVSDFTERDYIHSKLDDGHEEKRMLSLRSRARKAVRPKHRVVIATPTRGGVRPEYAATIWKLVYAGDEVLVDNACEVLHAWQWHEDVVRVRSRFVRSFLETNGTHLLFVDSDMSFEPVLLQGMLAAEKDFVAAPYPKRDKIDFEAVARPDAKPPEARAYTYPIRIQPGDKGHIDETQCAEVAGIGLGCALLSRECLETMVDHYRHELGFIDTNQGQRHPTVGLFHLILKNGELLSEDYSFCTRWRAIGGKIHMYLGPGSPCDHHGEHSYRGRIEALGLKRVAS